MYTAIILIFLQFYYSLNFAPIFINSEMKVLYFFNILFFYSVLILIIIIFHTWRVLCVLSLNTVYNIVLLVFLPVSTKLNFNFGFKKFFFLANLCLDTKWVSFDGYFFCTWFLVLSGITLTMYFLLSSKWIILLFFFFSNVSFNETLVNAAVAQREKMKKYIY